MKPIFLFLLCIISQSIFGQKANDLVFGKKDSIYSKILNEKRKIWVYVPEKPKFQKLDTIETYPVVYLLDGYSNFHSVSGMLKRMGHINQGAFFPKMIVVGVLNTNRWRDLTPNKGDKNDPRLSNDILQNSGGGENFISFIENELIPFVDSKYPTKNYRTFMGHSLGGLTVMNTFIKHNNIFDSYAAIDPSMKWAKEKLLGEIKNKRFGEEFLNKKLFLAIAHSMKREMDTLTVQKDKTKETKHIRSILKLNKYLKVKSKDNFDFSSKYYPDDDHSSVAMIAQYDALRFFFDEYRLFLNDNDYDNPNSGIANKMAKHYNRISNSFGFDIKPNKKYLTDLSYYFITEKQYKKAENLFHLIIDFYPDSYEAHDNLGDLYIKLDRKNDAINSYKKSKNLNSESPASEKLKYLTVNE